MEGPPFEAEYKRSPFGERGKIKCVQVWIRVEATSQWKPSGRVQQEHVYPSSPSKRLSSYLKPFQISPHFQDPAQAYPFWEVIPDLPAPPASPCVYPERIAQPSENRLHKRPSKQRQLQGAAWPCDEGHSPFLHGGCTNPRSHPQGTRAPSPSRGHYAKRRRTETDKYHVLSLRCGI